MRIAFVANTSWYLYNFRLNVMKSLQASGHNVVAVGPAGGYVSAIEKAGFKYLVIDVRSDGVNPLFELPLIRQLHKAFSNSFFDCIFSSTPKINLYCGIVTHFLPIVWVPNVSGLGRTFIRRSLLTSIVKYLYSITFPSAMNVFFQNIDDQNFFLERKWVNSNQVRVLPGSGVDTLKFQPSVSPKKSENLVFTLIARMLWDKGVGEFVDAARLVKKKHPGTVFRLIGPIGVANPAAIAKKTIESWVREEVVEYFDHQDDIDYWLKRTDCVVLPSYREGTPRSLLEAASCALPIITTDAVGCRGVVDDGLTGFLCRLKDSEDLAEKMLDLLKLNDDDRISMGRLGREKMIREYSEDIVINHYHEVLKTFEQTGH